LLLLLFSSLFLSLSEFVDCGIFLYFLFSLKTVSDV
jgi:hypothetical protein